MILTGIACLVLSLGQHAVKAEEPVAEAERIVTEAEGVTAEGITADEEVTSYEAVADAQSANEVVLTEEAATDEDIVGAIPIYTEAEAVEYMKEQFVNHSSGFSFTIIADDDSAPSPNSLYSQAVAYSDSCAGLEGDYLNHSGYT